VTDEFDDAIDQEGAAGDRRAPVVTGDGEVTLQAHFVARFIVKHTDKDSSPRAMEVLPAYDALARVTEGAYGQSDVLARWTRSSTFGYFSGGNQRPLFRNVLPHGFLGGFRALV